MQTEYVLIVRYPRDHGPANSGHVAPRRRMVAAGHRFTGKEGLSGGMRTGWYEPVGWLSVMDAAALLPRWDWQNNASGDFVSMARDYAATPADFPGLTENYGQLPVLTLEDMR